MRPNTPSDRGKSGSDAGAEGRTPERELPIFDPDQAGDLAAGEAFDDVEDEDEHDDEDDDEGEDEDEDDDEDDDEDENDPAEREDAALSEEIEGEPKTVLITGACGSIGRKLRAAWSDLYDLVLIDMAAREDDTEVIRADLAILDDDWITHFHGVDTVVHLAANSNELAPWGDLIGPNLDATANVFHAAALAGVERIIFSSSNHVMGQYQTLDDEPITVEREPRPDGPYGVTKLVGERLGQSLARAFDLTFIALRLGFIQEGRNRPETLPDDWARKMWLSNADLVQLFDCAVEAEIEDRSFVLVNGMSRNHGMRWDLSQAAELLGYLPEDDAFAVMQPSTPVDEAR
jgi:nucleoside-diphosphate-sugar epimerase